MIYLIIIIPMLLIFGYTSYGIAFESQRKQENKNDERWQLIVAKADNIALTTFYLAGSLMAGITLVSEILQHFDLVEELLSQNNLFELYKWYSLLVLCMVFAVRTYFLKHYDQKL